MIQAATEKSAVELRSIENADFESALTYAARVYRPNYIMFTSAFFDWQYRRCGGRNWGAAESAIGAFQDGQMVGASLVGRYPVRVRQQKTIGGWIHFWFADPIQPGLGIRLLRKSTANLAFLGGAAIELEALAVMHQLFGRGQWFETDRLFFPLAPELLTPLFSSRNAAGLLRTLSGLPVSKDVVLTEVDRFGPAFDSLWDQFCQNVDLTTDRDSAFMNWRYVDHPVFQYRRLICTGPSGTAVYVWRDERVSLADGTSISVCRLCEAIGTSAALSETAPALLGHLKRQGSALIDFFCSNREVIAALRAGGMYDAVTRPGFDLPYRLQPPEAYASKSIDFYYFSPDKSGMASEIDPGKTYITRGDSNQDAPIVLV
jgi:hypothetical protein